MSEAFLISIEGPTAIVTINRPEVYNALNRESKLALTRALIELGENKNIRSIILTGAGKAFCTGQDLNDRTIKADSTPVDLAKTLREEWVPLVQAIRELRPVVIACVNGVAAGAGVSIALAADFIVAHTNVKFVSSFAKIGLVPDAGSTYTMTRALGPKRAMEFFLLRDSLSAQEMHEAGLVKEVSYEPMSCAQELSHKINTLAPLSVAKIKQNVKKALEMSYNDCLELEIEAQGQLGASLDYQEGLKAFFEKRPAQFQGH
jgi:2-(1,2-epoxy-1,2-dihydrophenyl)acetyl-CoA isomerase